MKGVAVLLRDANSILLTLRKAGENIGTWELPAGHIEDGEDPAETVCREVLEETGLVVSNAQLIATFDVIHLFTATVDSGFLENREPNHHDAVGWFTVSALPSPRGPSLKYAIEHNLI